MAFRFVFAIFTFSVLYILSSIASAKSWTHQNGLCVTSPFATTSFAFTTEELSNERSGGSERKDLKEQRVKVSVVHHNGLEYAPFWDSPVVSADLKMLSEKAKMILQLGSELKTSWSAKDCQWTGVNKVACVGTGDRVKANSKTIEPWAFYTAVIQDSSFAGDFTYIQATLLFYIEGQKYIFTAKYPESDCNFDPKAR